MTEAKRQRLGGLAGYEIIRVEKGGDRGGVSSVRFEVLTPEGEFLDRFSSLDRAMRLIKSLAGIPLEEDDFYD